MKDKYVVILLLLASLGALFIFAACTTTEAPKATASAYYWENKKAIAKPINVLNIVQPMHL